ncbi:MAG: sulfurtransferase [Nitrospinota bacterium]
MLANRRTFKRINKKLNLSALCVAIASTAQGAAKFSRSVLLFFGIFAFQTFPAGAALDYPRADLLAEPAWLIANLNNPNIRIVDLRSEREYRRGHIPGATRLSLNEIRATRDGIRKMVAPLSDIEGVMGRLGIDAGTTVVAYDDSGGLHAARLYWTLEYMGHPSVKVLNGGFGAWVSAGGKLSREIPEVEPKTFRAKLNPSVFVDAQGVLERLGKKDAALVDARSPAEYSGEKSGSRRAGRIPGAVNIDWIEEVRLKGDRKWKSPEELRALFESKGVTPDKEVVVYCQTLHRASHTFFTLRLLGYDKVLGYDGSWQDWGNREDLPIER